MNRVLDGTQFLRAFLRMHQNLTHLAKICYGDVMIGGIFLEFEREHQNDGTK